MNLNGVPLKIQLYTTTDAAYRVSKYQFCSDQCWSVYSVQTSVGQFILFRPVLVSLFCSDQCWSVYSVQTSVGQFAQVNVDEVVLCGLIRRVIDDREVIGRIE